LITDECKLPNAVLRCKEDIVKNTNMTVVCPSNWIAQEASKSSVFSGKKIEVIPNAVDTGVYYPRSQIDVRDRLGISQEAFVILAGSTDNNEIRKGYKYYIDTINYCLKNKQFHEKSKNNQIVVITFGGKTDSEMHKKIMHIDIGYISDENVMAEIYSAADIYVITTLEDNLPNTVLESMACGTPVVGFNTGGLCDMVVNGVNGILVPARNAQALSESVLMLLQYPKKHRKYGRSALHTVRTGFTQALQSERYLELFRGLKTIESKYAAIDESSIYNCSLKKASRENILYRAGVLIRWILRRLYLVRV